MDEYKTNVFSSFPNGGAQQLEMVNPTYDQMIIKPPEKNKTHGKRTTRIIVDSRTRDKILYPDPSQYLIKLEYEHQDVSSIELTQANIPNTFYNVYEHYDPKTGDLLYANNRIYYYSSNPDLSKSNKIESICVKPGKYTDPCDFVEAINKALTNKVANYSPDDDTCNSESSNAVTNYFIYNSITQKISLKQDSSAYYFYFGEEIYCNPKIHTYEYIENKPKTRATKYRKFGIGELMGFLPNYVYSMTPISHNSIALPKLTTAHNILDLNCDKYIILDIRELHRLESNSEPIDDKFLVIPIDYEKCSTKLNIGSIPTQREIKYYSAPFPRLDRLTIRFLRYNGDPLFFNGVNHLLDFNITALNQPGKYNDGHSGTMLD